LNKSRGLRRRCRKRQQPKFQLLKLQSYKGCGTFTPRDPLNPLIKASLFPGGKGKTKKRPMTLEELLHIEQHLLRNGKKSHWAKELHRRIHSWDWEHPRSLPSFRNKVAVGKPTAGLNPLRTTNDLIQARKVRRQARSNRAPSQLQCFSYIGNEY